MSNVDMLLARLDGVQKSGPGWRARCPACGGKSRKVSVGITDDGKILVCCFGGCEALAVVQAVGLTLSDLFPERLRDDTPEGRRQAQRLTREAGWGAALEGLDLEAMIVLIAAQDTAAGKPICREDLDRLALAAERIADTRRRLRPLSPRDALRMVRQRSMPRPAA